MVIRGARGGVHPDVRRRGDRRPPAELGPAAEPDPSLMGGTQIGKRYTDEADTIQVLCAKNGHRNAGP